MAPLSVRKAAVRLGIAYSTLKQWIYAGRVRPIGTQGGHHRIPEAEIERLSAELPQQRKQTPRHARAAISVLGDSNRLSGSVEEVRSDGLIAQVALQIGGQRLTAVVTAEALNDLQLRRGDDAVAIIN